MLDNIRRKVAFLIYPEIEDQIWQLQNSELNAKQTVINSINVKDIMRHMLGSIGIDMTSHSSIYNGLTKDQQDEFEMFCYGLRNHRYWERVKQHLINTQAAEALQSMPMNEPKSWFSAGTFNGIALVFDKVDKMSSNYENRIANRDGAYDPHSITGD